MLLVCSFTIFFFFLQLFLLRYPDEVGTCTRNYHDTLLCNRAATRIGSVNCRRTEFQCFGCGSFSMTTVRDRVAVTFVCQPSRYDVELKWTSGLLG